MNQSLNIWAFPGTSTDCLGHYLIGIGLLRAVSSKWPEARGCWRNGMFHLAGPFTDSDVADFIAQQWQPTCYEKWWTLAQKIDTKAKTSTQLWAARSVHPLAQVRVADCTVVATNRNQFSPLFGTGGNVGKRNLETAWREANELRKHVEGRQWLEATLFGRETTTNPPFTNAGTWFVYNNKTFNSGLDWYREGSLSPWSFLLSMEGAMLVRGGSGRRLGARAQAYAVFPFISQPLKPAIAEEIGRKAAGEFWAPLWEEPATVGEIRALFQRGLARIGGRAAAAPHEFAVAALAAGADAGVTQFARFELCQTTSSQVYEALPRQRISVARAQAKGDGASPSVLLIEILGRRWFDSLPKEPTRRDSKVKFSGLRGPLERLILSVAREPDNPEPWRSLLLCIAETQARIDRNLKLRKSCRALPWLPPRWLARAFPGTPPLGIRLAVALASLGADSPYPAVCNVFGVEAKKFDLAFIPQGRPARAVWHHGEPQTAILDFTQRRLTDCKVGDVSPLQGTVCLTALDVAAFLRSDNTILELIQRWVPVMTLMDWSRSRHTLPVAQVSEPATPDLLLWAFFKPFFTAESIVLRKRNRKFFGDGSGPKPMFGRQLFNLLRHGAMDEAIALALQSYQAQGLKAIRPAVPTEFDHCRLASALGLSISPGELAYLVNRWLEPIKNNNENAQ